MDLIKDGEVTTEANYDSSKLDYAAADLALKYVDAILGTEFGMDQAQIDQMTNSQKATLYVNALRRWHKTAYRAHNIPARIQVHAEQEEQTMEAEVDGQMGNDEDD